MTTPSTDPSTTTLADEFAAALDWWREAGVDSDFSDDATQWLEEPAAEAKAESLPPKKAIAKAAQAPPPPPKKVGGDAESWPDNLESFTKWWTESKTIDDGGAFPIVPPRGPANPELLILVTEPEEKDGSTLLSDVQGRLLAGMLRASGMTEEHLFLASVLRRHTPMPDWTALKAAGADDLLAHYVHLVNPKRILSFGRNIPPLLGNEPAQGAAILQNFNHEGRSIPLMGAGSLAELLRSAPRRQRFWQRWLEWTGS